MENPNSPDSQTNKFAILALIAGIVAVFFFEFFVPSFLAVILGGLGLNRADELQSEKVQKSGKGMSIAGLVLGVVYLLVGYLRLTM